MNMKRRILAAAVAVVGTAGALGVAQSAHAAYGATATCNSGNVCISGDWHTPGSTTTTMTHGYRIWNETGLYLYGKYYSNSGGEVGGNGVSLRNRDLNGRDACYDTYDPGLGWHLYVKNTYAYVGWANTGSPGNVEQYRAY